MSSWLLFVGTYTRTSAGVSESVGIYTYRLCGNNLELVSSNAGMDNPSFLALHPSDDILFCVNEVGDYAQGNSGAVSSFAFDDNGGLELLSQQDSLGGDPCHLSIDRTGKMLLVANYGGGSLAAFPIGTDGRIGAFCSFVQHAGKSVDPMRQKSAHVHSVNINARQGRVYVPDLGLDQIVSYPIDVGRCQVDASDRRIETVATGAGPRHMCFSSDDRIAYVINELDNTIVSYTVEDDGRLVQLERVSTLPKDFTDASYCADLHISTDGRFLYASNRGHDSIAAFQIDTSSGRLTYLSCVDAGGRHPRNFCMTPDNQMLVANRDSSNIQLFDIDRRTGLLSRTGEPVSVPDPVCLVLKTIDQER